MLWMTGLLSSNSKIEGKRFGFGLDLPRGVVQQWVGLGQHPLYFDSILGLAKQFETNQTQTVLLPTMTSLMQQV